jgi:hypothetical protein
MRVLPAVLAAAVLAASAAAAGPAVRLTAAGNTAARDSLLTAASVGGKGWKASAPVSGGLDLSCPGWNPSGKGVVETGGAALPSLSSGGVIIGQMSSVYASAAQANTLWKRAVQPGLLTCVRQTLEAVSLVPTEKISVKILAQGPLSLTKVGPDTAGYRVVAELISTHQKVKTYFDVILLGRQATLSEITISSFVDPVPAKVEYAFAKIVYDQIGLPVA